jgi:predicted amidohydrolase
MIDITLAQIKPVLGDINKNAEIHFRLIEEAIDKKSDIIIFPELSLTGYSLRDLIFDVSLNTKSKIFEKFKEYSKNISVIVGFVYEDERHMFYNASGYFEDGNLVYLHKKVFLPNYTMFEESRYFSKGNRIESFNTKFFKAAILICEDALHISTLFSLSRQNIDTVFIVSNSPARGIFKDSFYSQTLWDNTIKFIATNLSVNVIFVNRVGVEEGVTFWGGSKVVSANGKKALELDLFAEMVKNVKLSKNDLRAARIFSPFSKDEDLNIVRAVMKNCGDDYGAQ